MQLLAYGAQLLLPDGLKLLDCIDVKSERPIRVRFDEPVRLFGARGRDHQPRLDALAKPLRKAGVTALVRFYEVQCIDVSHDHDGRRRRRSVRREGFRDRRHVERSRFFDGECLEHGLVVPRGFDLVGSVDLRIGCGSLCRHGRSAERHAQ